MRDKQHPAQQNKMNNEEVQSAYKAELNNQRKLPEKWNGGKSLAVVRAAIGALKKGDGSAVELSSDQLDIVVAIFNPNVTAQMKVVKKLVADVGGEIDEEVDALLRPLLNPAGVQKQIENANKPARIRIGAMIE